MKVFYAAGPGDIVSAHNYWRRGVNDTSQMALTYSGQFADFCQDVGATAHIVGYSEKPGVFKDENFLIEHLPKKRLGCGSIGFHVSELLYALAIARKARGSDVAFINSGTAHFFALWLLRAFGIKVVPVLHNTLWPAGYRKSGLIRSVIRKLNTTFLRFGAHAVIGVSPECIRQVKDTIGRQTGIPLIEIRGQFIESYFNSLPPPPANFSPFRLLFAGRIQSNKGVFDILQMAGKINEIHPGLIEWDICGTGPDLERLKAVCVQMQLNNVKIHGHLSPEKMRGVISRSHASIVPTRSSFAEGMALSAVEPILTGRPVITCAVVPALEVLRPACVEAETDNVDHYVKKIIKLATSPDLYARLCSECAAVGKPFYDRSLGLAVALKMATSTIHPLRYESSVSISRISEQQQDA